MLLLVRHHAQEGINQSMEKFIEDFILKQDEKRRRKIITQKINPFNYFIRKKPVLTLMELYKGRYDYGSRLAKAIDCTYSHMVKMIRLLIDLGLVNNYRDGRILRIQLTEKGKNLARDFMALNNFFLELDMDRFHKLDKLRKV